MKVGTRSVIFGAHQFLIHPAILFIAWWRLYGFPRDPRLWVAFVVHDLGYWGKPNMDGPEGETHPVLGAVIMGRLFGAHWRYFTLYHSRFYAKAAGVRFSRLCVADKLALVMFPTWLYLLLATLSGELAEYMDGQGARTKRAIGETPYDWVREVKTYVAAWVREHRDGREDTWTGTDNGRMRTREVVPKA